MLTMRKLIMQGILATALAAVGTAYGTPATRVLRFGLISDAHVTDKHDQEVAISRNAVPRYYTGGIAKLEAFALAMNRAGAAFVAELGDLTDDPQDESLTYEKRKSAVLGFLETAEAKLALFKGPKYHVLGNHDTDLLAKEDARAKWTDNGPHLPGQYYYSFNQGGIYFVVLDADYTAKGAPYSGVPGAPGADFAWDDANLLAEELTWLKTDLAAKKLPTIVLMHQSLSR
jgi:hypothetical protein